MSLGDRLQADLVAAMRTRDSFRLSTLRMIKAALKNKEVEAGSPLSEDVERAVLQTLLKQRRESAAQFREGNRQELATKEEQEAVLIQDYLPRTASADELRAALGRALRETGANDVRDIGKVMKAVLAMLADMTVDKGQLSAMVRERLESQ